MIDLTGKKALVTGGARGIGAACARLLAGAGADVAIAYRSRASEAAQLVDELQGLGRDAMAFQGDLATREANDACVASTVERFGHWYYCRGQDKKAGIHATGMEWWFFTRNKDLAVKTAKSHIE